MPKTKKASETVKFEYSILPTYTTYSVSGAFGGLNAYGEITVNFFYERGPIPKWQEYQIREDGKLSPSPKREERIESVVRNVLFAISMNPAVAKGLAEWLLEKVEEYEKRPLETTSH